MVKQITALFCVLYYLFSFDTVTANNSVRYVHVENVVNMRSEPSTDSLIVYQLRNDMEVTVLGTEGDWSYLSYDGVKGYLMTQYLIEKEEVETEVTDFFYHSLGYHRLTVDGEQELLPVPNQLSLTKQVQWRDAGEEDDVSRIVKIHSAQPLKGKKLIIDPGHGGNEAGASYFGVKEADETLALGLVLRDHLEREGAEVVLTVDEKFQKFRRMSLRERASFAKRYDADLFVSLHFNTNENPHAEGTETYYNRTPLEGEKNPYPDESERLANYIQAYLVPSIGTKDLGTKDQEYHVLRNNTVPSVLVEVAFLSNDEEVKQIQSASFKEKSSYVITQGVIHYFR